MPGTQIVDAIIFDPRQQREILTYSQLHIAQEFSANAIRDLNLDGEQILLMDRQYVFVSAQLKERLQQSRFKDLRFTEGLSKFAGAGKLTTQP